MTAYSLTEANKLVDAAEKRAKAAEDAIGLVRAQLVDEQRIGARLLAERDAALLERDHLETLRCNALQCVINEQDTLAAVNAKLDAERTRNDSLAADLNARRLELGQLRDELTRAKLEAIQLAAQRKHVGEFLRDAMNDAAPLWPTMQIETNASPEEIERTRKLADQVLGNLGRGE